MRGRLSSLPAISMLRRNRDFQLLLAAGLVSLTGDALLTVGLTFLVYALTGSTLASGLTLLAALVPQIALGSVAGVFVDRWDRRRTMITTNVLLAAGLVPLLFVRSADQVWIVYAVAFAQSTIAQLFGPAETALVPALVPDADLVAANALNGQNRDIARLVGSALGGVVAATGGIAAIAVVDAATFAVAATLLVGIRHRAASRVVDPDRAAPGRRIGGGVGRDWADGLRTATGSAMLRTVLLCVLILGVGEGVFGTLIAPWVHDVLHRGGQAYGLILSAQAIGGIAGGLATVSIGHRFSASALLGWGCVGFGAIDVALLAYPAVRPVLWPAFLLIVLVGTPAAVMNAGLMTVMQRHTVDASRGRAIGSAGAVLGAGMLVGVCLAAVLPRWCGVLPVLAVAQGLGPVAAGALVLVRRTAGERAQPVSADRISACLPLPHS